MRKLLLPLLLCLWFIPKVNAQYQYENNLNEEYVLKLSFNLIDRYYENGNVTLFLKSYLEVRSNEEFEQVFPDFTSVQNKSVRVKVFNGLIETIGKDKDFLYGNLLGITNDPITATYWTEYLLKYYPFSEISKKSDEKYKYQVEPAIENTIPIIDNTNSIRYQETWNIVGTAKSDEGTFEIVKYEDWSCSIILTISDITYTSFECSEEGKAKLKDKSGNIIKIEFVMPELVDVMIDILGNDTRFDYTTN